MCRLRIAVAGAGAIGRKHIALVASHSEAQLDAIVDPAPDARALAERLESRWFPSLEALFATRGPDGIILATPNHLHVEGALMALRHGTVPLVEKPVATSVDQALELARASASAGVPVLVGHHRRHNPVLRAARDCVRDGRLGRLTTVSGLTLFHKPDSYFAPSWRRSGEAGPILINLVHGIDDLRFVCGEIVSVQAIASHAVRDLEAEDTAAILLRFENGALGTFLVSDATLAPWSWELTSGENPDYPRNDAACYMIGGTHGSLALPGLELFSQSAERSWTRELERERLATAPTDPLAAQLAHFLRVIRREEPPLCDVLDATRTLAVIDAIRRAVKVAPEPAGLVEFIHDMPTRPTPASVSTGVASC